MLSFVDDLDDRVAEIARRSIEPARRETYDSGAAKVTVFCGYVYFYSGIATAVKDLSRVNS